jgi:D-sedoheptulose 7-phosphate isomerase
MNFSEQQYPANAKMYIGRLVQLLENTDYLEIDNAVDIIIKTWKSGKQIIVLGNGGSSMTALHMVTDWNKMIFLSTGIPFRGRTLLDNIGLVMAYGNDISFNDIFIEQLKNILQPGDLVLAISGSGNSENVLKAIQYANDNGGITLGLSGYNGGKLKNMAQNSVWVKINDMQLSEDLHSIFGHIVMQRICHIK